LSETVSLPASGAAPVLEWDEWWSLVRSKAEPAWVWVALDRETRQAVACCLGERREESCRFVWEQVPAPWREATCDTDFWEA
jgi:insertion element IS1 protein InsB